jgi:predicted Rdx family selenoprotein
MKWQTGFGGQAKFRAQRCQKLVQPERLLQHGARPMTGRNIPSSVSGHEKEGATPRRKRIGDRVNPLRAKTHVKNRIIEGVVVNSL